MAVSHIMLESYKKYILVSLILLGKVQQLPKYTSQIVGRFIKVSLAKAAKSQNRAWIIKIVLQAFFYPHLVILFSVAHSCFSSLLWLKIINDIVHMGNKDLHLFLFKKKSFELNRTL